jgi:hypothetical protein
MGGCRDVGIEERRELGCVGDGRRKKEKDKNKEGTETEDAGVFLSGQLPTTAFLFPFPDSPET